MTMPKLAEKFLPEWAEDLLLEYAEKCQDQRHVEHDDCCDEQRGMCVYCAARALEEVIRTLAQKR